MLSAASDLLACFFFRRALCRNRDYLLVPDYLSGDSITARPGNLGLLASLSISSIKASFTECNARYQSGEESGRLSQPKSMLRDYLKTLGS